MTERTQEEIPALGADQEQETRPKTELNKPGSNGPGPNLQLPARSFHYTLTSNEFWLPVIVFLLFSVELIQNSPYDGGYIVAFMVSGYSPDPVASPSSHRAVGFITQELNNKKTQGNNTNKEGASEDQMKKRSKEEARSRRLISQSNFYDEFSIYYSINAAML